jgi:hypothetical protein
VLFFTVLTDIDINGCDMHMETPPPSVPATFRGRPTSYRLNNDVFFMSAGILLCKYPNMYCAVPLLPPPPKKNVSLKIEIQSASTHIKL